MEPPSDTAAAIMANGGREPGVLAALPTEPEVTAPDPAAAAAVTPTPTATPVPTATPDPAAAIAAPPRRRTAPSPPGKRVRLIQRRIGFLFAVFLALLLIGGAKAAWLGVVKAGSLKRAAATQQKADITVPGPPRGDHGPRRHRARGLPAGGDDRRDAVPGQGPGGVASRLAPLLDRREEDLIKQLTRRDTGFVYLARRIPPRRARRVQRMKIEGLEFIPEFKRIYPRDWMASQLIGVTGADNQGLAGLEFSLDKDLHGRTASASSPRTRSATRSTCARPSARCPGPTCASRSTPRSRTAPRRCSPRSARSTSPRARPRSSWTRATAASSRWRTGRRSNANNPGDAPDFARQDRAIGATYEPGSTFKAFTVAGAVEQGEVTPDTSFDLPPTIKVADREIGESHPVGYRTLTTAGILKESSNVGAIMIGQRLGADDFDKWVRRFGFGKPTGIDLPGEEQGIVLPVSEVLGRVDGQPADRPGHRGDADADGDRLRGAGQRRHPAAAAHRRGRRRRGRRASRAATGSSPRRPPPRCGGCSRACSARAAPPRARASRAT